MTGSILKRIALSPWMASSPYCSLSEAVLTFVPDRCRCRHASKNHACLATFLAYHSSSDDSNDFFKRLEYGPTCKMPDLFVLCFPLLLWAFSVHAEATKSRTSFMKTLFVWLSGRYPPGICWSPEPPPAVEVQLI